MKPSDDVSEDVKTASDPLILTARFDPASAAVFQRLRERHFPARLNTVPAHLTLFHNLPGREIGAVAQHLTGLTGGETPLSFRTAGLRKLGHGVAIEIDSVRLGQLHARLAHRWGTWLIPQDRQSFRPHVTVQNKADPAAARTLHAQLATAWQPMDGEIVGLDLWHYRSGPWEPAGHFSFRADRPPPLMPYCRRPPS